LVVVEVVEHLVLVEQEVMVAQHHLVLLSQLLVDKVVGMVMVVEVDMEDLLVDKQDQTQDLVARGDHPLSAVVVVEMLITFQMLQVEVATVQEVEEDSTEVEVGQEHRTRM
jgi:hypothetical protein